MPPELESALAIRDQLRALQARLVLAESCTAGRIAATLGELPGISEWLCGSFVVYRSSSKAAWLGISTELLEDPQAGPVSAAVTQQLAQAALQRTPEAKFGFAITGDMGPGASARTDGLAFCSLATRAAARVTTMATTLRLQAPAPRNPLDLPARRLRLEETTRRALALLAHQLADQASD